MNNKKIRQHSDRENFLDVLRILASTSVFVGHAFDSHLKIILTNHKFWASPLVEYMTYFYKAGIFGVSLFFVISGYIITKCINKETTTEFLIRRFFRIFPIYWVSLTCYAIFIRLTGQPNLSRQQYMSSALLIGDFTGAPPLLNGVEWTLRIEILFYIFMALAKSLINDLFILRKISLIFLFGSLISIWLMPKFPLGFFTHSYANIFSSYFVIGITFSLYNLKVFKLHESVFLISLSCFMILLKQKALRPELSLYGPHTLLVLIIFSICYMGRNYISDGKFLSIFSSLTYPTYLFHNWTFFGIQAQFNFVNSYLIKIIISLSIFYIMIYLIEVLIDKPCLKIGKSLIKLLNLKSKREF